MEAAHGTFYHIYKYGGRSDLANDILEQLNFSVTCWLPSHIKTSGTTIDWLRNGSNIKDAYFRRVTTRALQQRSSSRWPHRCPKSLAPTPGDLESSLSSLKAPTRTTSNDCSLPSIMEPPYWIDSRAVTAPLQNQEMLLHPDVNRI